ncbi:MAG: PfkB family carbohydrate kinase [Candidatus Polarisedimenticolia bacterium]
MDAAALDVVGIGIAPRDITVLIDPLPPADAKGLALDFAESGGGPVPTALVTLARLGHRCVLGGVVGNDAAGRLVNAGLRSEGVGTQGLVVRDGLATPTSVILVESGGRRRVCEWNQRDLPLGPEDLTPLHPLLARCRALLVDARFPEAQIDAARRAREAGALVMLDCGHPRPGVDELLSLCDVAILSASYMHTVHGARHDPAVFLHSLRARLAPGGLRLAGLTLGPDGCLIVDDDTTAVHVSAPSVDALDTTGAGDVFHGALLHELLRGAPAIEAASFANAAAALSCRALTGRAPLPREPEIRSLALRLFTR